MNTDVEPRAEITREPERKASWGALISICILLGLFVIAALYVWGERVHEEGGVIPSTQDS